MSDDTTLDQAIANLHGSMKSGVGPTLDAVKRIVAVTNSHRELFNAASVVLDWMRTISPKDRPIAKFNRLLDAINGVREAHQMKVNDVI